SPRNECREAVDTIRTVAPEAVLARIEAVAARLPGSSQPWAHHVEVLMWLGRYDEARASLERALAIAVRTRWPWDGLGVLEILAERPAGALDLCARGTAAMAGTKAPFIHAVRGEALRRMGRLDDAAAALGKALAA